MLMMMMMMMRDADDNQQEAHRAGCSQYHGDEVIEGPE
jgi:hypothetical protein